MTDEDDIRPKVLDGVPYCTYDDCPMYDGKRCKVIGARPGNICEPAVRAMAERIDNLMSDDS